MYKGSHYYDSLHTYRKYAMEAAKELGYGGKVVKDILHAKSEKEIERILATARNQG